MFSRHHYIYIFAVSYVSIHLQPHQVNGMTSYRNGSIFDLALHAHMHWKPWFSHYWCYYVLFLIFVGVKISLEYIHHLQRYTGVQSLKHTKYVIGWLQLETHIYIYYSSICRHTFIYVRTYVRTYVCPSPNCPVFRPFPRSWQPLLLISLCLWPRLAACGGLHIHDQQRSCMDQRRFAS